MTLDDLGPRICIVGPSGSGKSTLAVAIGRARGVNVVHLDRLHHLPHTDWHPRPTEDFVALHDEAIQGDQWVIEGNYFRCMPSRLARATGVILLDLSTPASLLRYIRRSLFQSTTRAGALDGNRDSVKWSVIHHIAIPTRAHRKRYVQWFARLDLPKLSLMSPRDVQRFYTAENLQRGARKVTPAIFP